MEKVKQEVRILAEREKQEVQSLRNGRSGKYRICGTGEAGSTEFAEREKREVRI
ncbi:MAG: hypothetical protein HXK81_07225 [Lachnospiraceae bacterium]|nr:hypothetical protein [Lachnospiraceae bacterium]